MKSRLRGFTLVELIIVIAVIGILATVASLGFGRFQADTRDARRVSSASIIVEALEKYYDINGEYPSCADLVAPGNTVSADILKGISPQALVTPQAPNATTNSLSCGTLTVNGTDFFEYQGDGSSSCTGSVACLKYTLKYKSEISNAIVSIDSRRNATIASSGAPTLTRGTIGYTQMAFSWTAVPNAISYTFQRSSTANFTSATSDSYTSQSAALTGLTPGTQYYFRVGAATNDSSDAGAWSNTIIASTKFIATPVITCASPANSMVQINVSWGAITDATSYTLQRATSSGFSPVTTTSNLTGTSTPVTGLAAGTTYFFRLQALGAEDVSNQSAYVSCTTNSLATPSITVTVNSSTATTVSWSSITNATSYTLRRSVNSDMSGATSTPGLTGTSAPVTGLAPGQTYYFTLQANAPTDNSTNSAVKSGTNPVNPPGAYTTSATRAWDRVTASSNASCASGTTPQYLWNVDGTNDAISASSSRLKTIGWGQSTTVSVNTRCTANGSYSAYVAASNNQTHSLSEPEIWVGLLGERKAGWSSSCPAGTTGYSNFFRIRAYSFNYDITYTNNSPSGDTGNAFAGQVWGDGSLRNTVTCTGPWGDRTRDAWSSFGYGCTPVAAGGNAPPYSAACSY